ncbi:MAG: methylated-DNA--[Clostridia bacterium]|nr:methylated-DNA--[protein]-cysteine S-methyltransferase [Clostridia bacterium]
MNRRIIDTPAGRLELTAAGGRLCAIRAAGTEDDSCVETDDPVLEEAARQLAQYFAGERREFDLPLHMEGSAFDRAVWRQLLDIPFGEISTYGKIAAALGKPKASRAVGGACSRNPLLIVVPCHRVIAGTGKLTGFAAGLAMKRSLLALEGWHIQSDLIKDE